MARHPAAPSRDSVTDDGNSERLGRVSTQDHLREVTEAHNANLPTDYLFHELFKKRDVRTPFHLSVEGEYIQSILEMRQEAAIDVALSSQ